MEADKSVAAPTTHNCSQVQFTCMFMNENFQIPKRKNWKNAWLSTTSSSFGMSTSGSDEYFQSTNHVEQTFRKMENYLQQKQLCDVVLIPGDQKIPAHRLSTTSSSFGMSTSGSDEYFQSTNHVEQTFRKMENYLQQKQLCDVVLIPGDQKIPAH
ncbi:hypothetical protein HGM15179_021086, partial [Zosterops borbonicus]